MFEKRKEGAAIVITKVTLGFMPVIGTVYVLNTPEYLGVAVYKAQYLSLFLTLALVSTFLSVPARKGTLRTTLPWYDGLLVLLSVMVGGYPFVFYPEIIPTLGYVVGIRIIFGAIMIILVLEAGRRLIGLPIVVIGVLFVLYSAYAYLLPGILHARMIPWHRVLTYLYLSPGALFGIPAYVAGTIAFSFIFFGRLLFSTGGGEFLSNVALSLMGGYRGGPAKVAVIASCLFGTLSGSAAANVAMTGMVTIPLMKKIGYSNHIAGAIEASASTGGLIMPPIMAATAFIMAEFLEIPYRQIAFAAFIPASLYYVVIFCQVHLEAAKLNLKGLPREELPSLSIVLRSGWIFVLPVAVLLYSMFFLYFDPSKAAILGMAAMVLVCLFRRGTRNILRHKGWEILVETGRGLLEVVVICCIAGLVIGTISLTGLGLILSDALVKLSGGNVLVLLVLAALGAIILGMGMPITATYIMLVVLVAPALIDLGIEPLAAHLFIMYFGCMSFITPPVAIATYVAAGIANSNPMRTSFAAIRLSIVAYIVPFMFALSPSLILLGSLGTILTDIVTALIGSLFLSVAFVGYLFGNLTILKRIVFMAGAFSLIVPRIEGCFVGAVLILPLLFLEIMKKRRIDRERLHERPYVGPPI